MVQLLMQNGQDVPIPMWSGLIWNTIDDCVYENQVEFLYDIFSFTDSISLAQLIRISFYWVSRMGKWNLKS